MKHPKICLRSKDFLITCFCIEIYIHISMMSFGTVNTASVWFCHPPSYILWLIQLNFKCQFIFFLPVITGPSCWNCLKMQNKQQLQFCLNRKQKSKKTNQTNDKHLPHNNREDIYIYICKSTFVLILALEWKQQQRGSLWSTNGPPCTQHIPPIYYLCSFTGSINMHE